MSPEYYDGVASVRVKPRFEIPAPGTFGHPERRERDYVRHGTRALSASLAVPTGEVVWDLGPRRTNDDFAAHLLHTLNHFAGWPRITWVLDNLNIHWS